MTLKRRSGGSWVDIATTLKRRSSGSWVGIDFIRKRAGGIWSVVWQTINISDITPSAIMFTGTPTARYQLRADGTVRGTLGNNTVNTLGNWLTAGSSGDYEVRATLNSGSLSSGTTGSWLALSSDREWTRTQSTVGDSTAVLGIEIRNATTLAVVDTATITLYAEKG